MCVWSERLFPCNRVILDHARPARAHIQFARLFSPIRQKLYGAFFAVTIYSNEPEPYCASDFIRENGKNVKIIR